MIGHFIFLSRAENDLQSTSLLQFHSRLSLLHCCDLQFLLLRWVRFNKSVNCCIWLYLRLQGSTVKRDASYAYAGETLGHDEGDEPCNGDPATLILYSFIFPHMVYEAVLRYSISS